MSNETIIFFELAVGFIISTTIHRIMQKNVPRSSKRNLLKREQRMLLREINALIEARLKQLQIERSRLQKHMSSSHHNLSE